MEIEYEATITNVNKDVSRARLKKAGAKLIRSEFLQKRVVFNLPTGHEIKGGWLRVRNEGDKVTMSLKVVDGEKIENQKEICLKIDSFDQAEALLSAIGCERKAFQESKRELWKLDNVDITIDEWPFLEPFVEVEGASEEIVKRVCEKLGFDYNKAFFGSVDSLYSKKYSLPEEVINNYISEIVFNGKNPFKRNIKKHISAGCFVIREIGGATELLLSHWKWDGGTSGWVPPKGHVEEGESHEDAAMREVAEESGYTDIEIVKYLRQNDILFETADGLLHKKEIHWFLANLVSDKQVELKLEEGEKQRFMGMRWVPLAKAVEMIPFVEEKEIVNELINSES